MKTRSLLIIALFAICVFKSYGQSRTSSYLSKAMEKLDAGDCESAQKFYNVYKELGGNAKPTIETLIEECKVKVGNIIEHEGESYTIAYVYPNKKHGYAIKDAGVGSITKYQMEQQLIPSYEELVKIYENREELGLMQDYWCSQYSTASFFNGSFFETMYIATTINFANGTTHQVNITHKRNILLIYRF